MNPTGPQTRSREQGAGAEAENIRRVVAFLERNGSARASDVGVHLWGWGSMRKPQHFCLPAGKLLYRMAKKGLVWRDRDRRWQLQRGVHS